MRLSCILCPSVQRKAAGRGRINYDYDEKGEDVGGAAHGGGGGFRRPRGGGCNRRRLMLSFSYSFSSSFVFFFLLLQKRRWSCKDCSLTIFYRFLLKSIGSSTYLPMRWFFLVFSTILKCWKIDAWGLDLNSKLHLALDFFCMVILWRFSANTLILTYLC